MSEPVHMMTERKGRAHHTKCGQVLPWATIWHVDVTCVECLSLLGVVTPVR